ncbi:protein EXPORTIN 1A-like [Vigna umbellata]|uniref:protein EXPORTIN 1A-like n=1 Tax=Vigna umbellata TaxID=87088 RepID=UPI001F5EE582|nr:protein EXPORTIN 1A-like [Vigna umbellata]
MLNVYRMYSELISKSIAEGGPFASRTSYVKLLRSVKRETLKLVDTFLDKAEDQPQIAKHFVPPMMDPVLGDYARNVPDARESEVLSLFATVVNKYKAAMVEDVPRIFEAVFQCTLEMITKNFEDYPEHRLKFFSLLRAIATHCFPALICLSSQQLKLVMDSIIWAFRHTERNIAETGLNLLFEMLKKFQYSLGTFTQIFSGHIGTIELTPISVENSLIAGFSYDIPQSLGTYAPGNTTRIYGSEKNVLPHCLCIIFRRTKDFSGGVFSLAATVMSDLIQKDPTCYPVLDADNLPFSFLDAITDDVLNSSAAITCIP